MPVGMTLDRLEFAFAQAHRLCGLSSEGGNEDKETLALCGRAKFSYFRSCRGGAPLADEARIRVEAIANDQLDLEVLTGPARGNG
jgi:hypothetical protein